MGTHPPTRADSITEALHGVTISDPYRWLEDESSAEVQAWMNVQDAHARATSRRCPGRDELAARFRELFYYDAVSAPSHRKGRYFYTRKHADKEKTIVYWKQGENGEERVLFDPNTLERRRQQGPRRLVADARRQVRRVLDQARTTPTRRRRTCIDVATGKDLPDAIEGTKYARRIVDARRQRLLLHVGPADQRRGHDRGSPRLRRGALPRARHRSGEGSDRSTSAPATRRRSSAAASRSMATGCVAVDLARLELDRRLPQGRAQPMRRGRTVVEGVDATFERRRVARPDLPHDERRRAALSRLQGRSDEAASARRGRRSSRRARRRSRACRSSASTSSPTYLRNAATRSRCTISTASSCARSRCPRSAARVASAAIPTRTPATSRTPRSPSRR